MIYPISTKPIKSSKTFSNRSTGSDAFNEDAQLFQASISPDSHPDDAEPESLLSLVQLYIEHEHPFDSPLQLVLG